MTSWLLALSLAACPAAQEPEGVPAILERVPSELPRAADEHWRGFFDPRSLQDNVERLDPGARSAMSAAEESYVARDLPATVERLYRALTLEPDLPPAWLLLGTAYFRLRRYEDSIHCFERLLLLAPEQVWRTQALGHGYYSIGEFERARDHYRRVLDGVPDDAPPSVEALRGLALANMRLGEEDAALRLLARVVEIDPEHAEAALWTARILYDLERTEEALSTAERARELAPHEPGPWFLLTQIYFDLGRDEDAQRAQARWRELDRLAQEIRLVEGYLRVRPGDWGTLQRLIELERAAGDARGVRAALARLVPARPEGVRELDLRIYALDVLWEMGDREGAREAARALESACADEWEAWRRLEDYYGATGDLERRVRAGERYRRLHH